MGVSFYTILNGTSSIARWRKVRKAVHELNGRLTFVLERVMHLFGRVLREGHSLLRLAMPVTDIALHEFTTISHSSNLL